MRIIPFALCLLILLPFLLGGCQKELEFDLPAHAPRLVINSVFNPDSLFTVDLTISQSAHSNEGHAPVPDATVQIFQGGRPPYDLRHTGNGMYVADRKPQALQHYEVRVSAPGFPKASATSHVPAAPIIREVKANKVVASDAWGGGVDLSFVLEDAPDQENFYYLQAYTPDTIYHRNIIFNRAVWPRLVSPIEEEFSMETRYFFSDKLFNGQSVRFRLNLENRPERITYVRVGHITKEYYNYVRVLVKQNYADSFGIITTPVPNNIQNGFGLFAGYNAVTLAVRP